jgi:hypothetical protein
MAHLSKSVTAFAKELIIFKKIHLSNLTLNTLSFRNGKMNWSHTVNLNMIESIKLAINLMISIRPFIPLLIVHSKTTHYFFIYPMLLLLVHNPFI